MNLIGTTINGYTFTEFIDTGGFGAVYSAEKRNTKYAIKVFREDYVLQELRRSKKNNRIQREIDILKSVDHSNLIKYIDDFQFNYHHTPNIFLVMEFAPGRTLRAILDTHGKLDVVSAKNISLQIICGLTYLHNIRGEEDDKGVIHRDLHPKNIIVDDENHVKIIDYGISKIIDYSSITKSGDIMGFPPYMSPEQITDSKNIDKRSDQYSLGVVLYETLTGKLPYSFTNFPELVDKIKNQPPTPPRVYFPKIPNQLENIILKLLEKEPYNRFPKIESLNISIAEQEVVISEKTYDLTPKFHCILWNEKTILSEYIKTHDHEINVILPAHHQFQQKWMFDLDQIGVFNKIIDPSTIRLAYGSYTDVKGLVNLPYSPSNYEVITPSHLRNYRKQTSYVSDVLQEQHRLGGDKLISPFHYAHNTTVLPSTQRNPVAEWFDLDMKLLKESIDFIKSKAIDKEILAGVCLNAESLNDYENRRSILNHYSSFDCDGYVLFVDGIDKKTPISTHLNYIETLLDLQKSTGKPVIAARINVGLGLGLLSLGLSGFSMGASRFESFSEDLYKEPAEPYNLYERYYLPELLTTIPIERANPTRLVAIRTQIGGCNCPYCSDKSAFQIISNKNSKLHFLHHIHQEVNTIAKLDSQKAGIAYYKNRIKSALEISKKLSGIFTSQNLIYLRNWETTFSEIEKRM